MALSSQPNCHRRTHSDVAISTSLDRPVKPPPLQTIPSRKYSLNISQSSQLNLADNDMYAMKRRKPPRSPLILRRTKSEEDLDQELKGLKISDSEMERDTVPELRKQKKSEVKVKKKTRRYSSDWRPIDEEERKRVLGDWSVLTKGDEKDVKEQLRMWAYVVASGRLLGESS